MVCEYSSKVFLASPEIAQEEKLSSRILQVAKHQLLEVHLLVQKGDLEVSEPTLAAGSIVAIMTLWLQLAAML